MPSARLCGSSARALTGFVGPLTRGPRTVHGPCPYHKQHRAGSERLKLQARAQINPAPRGLCKGATHMSWRQARIASTRASTYAYTGPEVIYSTSSGKKLLPCRAQGPAQKSKPAFGATMLLRFAGNSRKRGPLGSAHHVVCVEGHRAVARQLHKASDNCQHTSQKSALTALPALRARLDALLRQHGEALQLRALPYVKRSAEPHRVGLHQRQRPEQGPHTAAQARHLPKYFHIRWALLQGVKPGRVAEDLLRTAWQWYFRSSGTALKLLSRTLHCVHAPANR